MQHAPLLTATLAVITLGFLHLLVKAGAGAGVEQGMAGLVLLVGAGVVLRPFFGPAGRDEGDDDLDLSA